MSIAFVKKKRLTFHSEQLQRDVFIDELSDLTDDELRQLTVELESQIKYLRDDLAVLPESDSAHHHVRHKMGIARGYLQQCDIEKGLREAERPDGVAKLRSLLVAKLGEQETALLFKAAGFRV